MKENFLNPHIYKNQDNIKQNTSNSSQFSHMNTSITQVLNV